MLSENEIDNRIGELLLRELKGFECPVCAHHEFAQLDALGENLRTGFIAYDGNEPTSKAQTRLISIACTNCGHIEQFAELPLKRRVLQAAEASP